MTRDEFMSEVDYLSEDFKVPSDKKLNAYYERLKLLRVEDLHKAFVKIQQESPTRFPSCIDIEKIIFTQSDGSVVRPSQFVSFRCKRCGTDFAVLKKNLEIEGRFKCGYCKFYYDEDVWIDTTMLRNAIDSAIMEGISVMEV